jgi:hypothetical protein
VRGRWPVGAAFDFPPLVALAVVLAEGLDIALAEGLDMLLAEAVDIMLAEAVGVDIMLSSAPLSSIPYVVHPHIVHPSVVGLGRCDRREDQRGECDRQHQQKGSTHAYLLISGCVILYTV